MSRRGFVKVGVGALLGAGGASCLPEPTPLDPFAPDAARLTARPAAPTGTPTLGATWLELARTRDSILYVPDAYDPASPAPLLVMLHGRGGGALDWAPLYPKLDDRGIVMLAVESRGVTWDRVSPGLFGADVTYMDAALARTFDLCAIDPVRVGLAGFSDGASYALSLGPSNGDLFTHLIAFSPGFSLPGRQAYGAPQIWISHGSNDPVLPEEYTFHEIVPTLRQEYLVTYVRFDGGHEIPAEISTQALDWFVGV